MTDHDDAGEMWREYREASQEKRAVNRAISAQMLVDAGIQFESRNDGAHLIVEGRYDFWPGTGLWMARGEKTKRRGVRQLIARIKGGKP